MRIMVHIAHAVQEGQRNIYILSSDTDVLVMALYHFKTYEAEGIQVNYSVIFFQFSIKYASF